MKRLKTVLQDYAITNNVKWSSDDDLINKTMDYFFDFEMPSYMWVDPSDPSRYGNETRYFKKTFLQNFLYDYIAFNSVDRFKSRLQNAIRIRFPYYNDMLWAEQWPRLFITNPAANTDYKEIYKKIIDVSRDQTGNNQSISNTVDNGSGDNSTISDDTSHTSDVNHNKTISNSTNNLVTKDNSDTSGDSSSLSIDNDYPKSEMLLDQIVLGDYATTANKASGNTKSGTVSSSTSDSTGTTDETTDGSTTSDTKSNGSSKSNFKDSRETLNNMLTNYLEKNKDLSKEDFEFQRVGNIGIQTPGEVFEKTRRAYINVIEMILKDKMFVKLFSLIIDEEDDDYEFSFY